jgi:hypothetical protein
MHYFSQGRSVCFTDSLQEDDPQAAIGVATVAGGIFRVQHQARWQVITKRFALLDFFQMQE